jgi:hypothetical protein
MDEELKKMQEEICYLNQTIALLKEKCPIEIHYHYTFITKSSDNPIDPFYGIPTD